MTIAVRTESTPNPLARRFLLDRPVQEQPRGRAFTDAATADDPLARALLELDGVERVMLLPTSVTVTRSEAASWDELGPATVAQLEAYFS
jgi:NFU1 iron-sulfur cluster scaffold homolog, mitochondrial